MVRLAIAIIIICLLSLSLSPNIISLSNAHDREASTQTLSPKNSLTEHPTGNVSVDSQKSFELQISEPILWSAYPSIKRQKLTFKSEDRSGSGELLIIPPSSVKISQEYIQAAVEYDFQRYYQIPQKPIPGKAYKPWPGIRIDEYVKINEQKDNFLIVSDSLETGFFMPNGFIITRGKLVAKPKGTGLFDVDSMGISDGEFSVFVLDEGNVGIRKVTIRNNEWVKTSPTENIKEAIFTLPMRENSKDVVGNIVDNLAATKTPSAGPHDAVWPIGRSCAVSMMGADKSENIYLLHIASNPNTPEAKEPNILDALSVLKYAGCTDVALLGLSADVHRYMLGENMFEAKARVGSTSGVTASGKLRGIAVFLIFSKKESLDRPLYSSDVSKKETTNLQTNSCP